MAASYVSLVLDVFAGSGSPAPMGYAKLAPSATLTDAPDQQWIPPIPVEVPFTGSATPPVQELLATDGGGPQPAGWTWGINFPGVPGQPAGFSFFLPAGPASFSVTDAIPAVFTFTPTARLTALANGTGVRLTSPPVGFSAGVTYFVVNASGFTFELAASTGGPPIASQSAGSGTLTVAQVNLSAIAPAESGTAFASYLPLTSGTPSAGQVPTFTGSGFATAPGNPATSSGTVTSLSVVTANGLSGSVANPTTTPAVTLSTTASGVLKGAGGAIQAATAGTDYVAPTGSGAGLTGITAAQVGADASGSASAAQSNAETYAAALAAAALSSAETFATSAVATETSRAETAEGLLAPKASPALTGTPTAPTATAGTSTTQVATTAYAYGAAQSAQTAAEAASDPAGSAAAAQSAAQTFATTAVGTEASRAEAAEALLAPKASPALTGIPTAPTASALANSTQLATTAYADSAVAAETSRAETAEALKAPLASPALTGTPTAPTATSGTTTTQLATTAFVGTAVTGLAPLASPALTGSPTAPTQTTGDSSTKIATDAFVATAVATETSRAQAAEGLLAPKASAALTGTPTAPTASALTASTQLATTAYADSAVAVETSRAQTAEALKAPLASPALTGTPTAPTAAALTASTAIASTAYADAAVAVETARAELAEATISQTNSRLLSSCKAATMPVWACSSPFTLGSGNLYLTSVVLPAGLTVSQMLMCVSSTAEAGGSHGWYVLLDSSLVVRAVTADQTGAAVWGQFDAIALSFGASYTTTYSGRYLAGVCVVASTMPTFCGAGGIANNAPHNTPTFSPPWSGESSTGQSTPPAVGATMAAVGTTAFNFYVELS